MNAKRGAVALLCALVGFALGPLVPARADAVASVSAVGWWSKRPGASALSPGFFEVATGVDGVESVAALRVDLTSPVSQASIVLTESSAPAMPGSVEVCTTSAQWSPANPGAYTDAPKSDCTVSTKLTRDAGSGTWSGDITALLSSHTGSVSLMVLPMPNPVGGLVDPGFMVQFQPASIRADAAPSPPPTSTSYGSGATGGASAPTASPPTPTPAAPIIAVPPYSQPSATASAAATSTAPRQAATAAPAAATVAVSAHPGAKKHWGRLWWVVPLALVITAASVLVRRFVGA